LNPAQGFALITFPLSWPDSSMVEQLTLNQLVRGSSPRPATSGFFVRGEAARKDHKEAEDTEDDDEPEESAKLGEGLR
jgi:hypothetical protein